MRRTAAHPTGAAPRGPISGQVGHQPGEGDQSQGQVDIEDPAPACGVGDELPEQRPVVGQPAAEGRATDGGEGVDAAHDPLPPPALDRRDEIADRGEDERDAGAGAGPLQGAEDDELVDGAREAAQQGADHEGDGPGEQEAFAPELIGELAGEGDQRRRSEQVGRDRPAVAVEAVQLADDTRHGRADDGLIQRLEQQGQHQGEHGAAQGPTADPTRLPPRGPI